jgi:hypothetical protein
VGVTRKSGRGLPKNVFQEELKNKQQQEAVRGTVKASVLQGDKDCPSLVACSVYDTKPVHFLSMTCTLIEWIPRMKKVFSNASKAFEQLKFLCLNINNDYNYGMGDVDVSDQSWNSYRFNIWIRQYKWSWSIFLWWLGVSMVNTYVLYKKFMIEQGVDKKDLLSQYKFRHQIALSWIDSTKILMRQRKARN